MNAFEKIDLIVQDTMRRLVRKKRVENNKRRRNRTKLIRLLHSNERIEFK